MLRVRIGHDSEIPQFPRLLERGGAHKNGPSRCSAENVRVCHQASGCAPILGTFDPTPKGYMVSCY